MLERFADRRIVLILVALAGVGLLGGYGVAMRARPKAEAISLESRAPKGREAKAVSVHVGGAVARPGLYELREGARVNDAVDAAGGTSKDADLDGLNLAAKVKDGDKVLVPTRAVAGGPGAQRPEGAERPRQRAW